MPRNYKYYIDVMSKMKMEEAENFVKSNLTRPQRACEEEFAKRAFVKVFGKDIEIKEENDRVKELIRGIKGEDADKIEITDKLKKKIETLVETEVVEQMEEKIAKEDERILNAIRREQAVEPPPVVKKKPPARKRTRKR